MKVTFGERFFSFKIISLGVFMLVLAIIFSQYAYRFHDEVTTIAAPTLSKCPFQHIYHFGDGITDIGNSIHAGSNMDNPAAKLPYGTTYPGWPSGRWSDGQIDFDYASADFGLPNIVPYLTMNSTNNDGVIFSVARSPVLDKEFFESRGIIIPSYAVSLSGQMSWFKIYLKSMCSTTQKDCANLLGNSLILLGDIEGNDIGYALTQGKSIEDVKTYVPFIVMAQIDAARELIKLGATLVIIPGNVPVGCYPYILTAFETDDPTAYDDLLCLKSVNDLIVWKNNYLKKAIADLTNEFPGATIYYGNMYDGLRSVIRNASVIGPDGNSALKACCGIGGKYNFDSKRFCGSYGVPVCSNPNEYVYWDGMHYTQHAQFTFEQALVGPALEIFNCTHQIQLDMFQHEQDFYYLI